MDIFGSAGHDNIVGTALADVIDVTQGGRDTVAAGDGDDNIYFGTELNDRDEIDGGAGYDRVHLDGNYLGGLTLVPASLINVEELVFGDGDSYTLTMDDATAAGVTYFYISAGLLDAGDNLFIDFSAETDVIYDILDGAGDDTFIGGSKHAVFRLQAGEDTATGGGSFDSFYMGAGLSAGDSLDGGGGEDELHVSGDYSAGLVITGSMASNFEELYLGGDVNLTILDDVYSGIHAFRVRVPSFGGLGGNYIIVDASDETDSPYEFDGGTSDDTFMGGALGDVFDFAEISSGPQGGNDVVEGNGGDDVVIFDEKFTRDDGVDGGAGFDVLELEGDYSAGVNFSSTTMKAVEEITLAAGFSYDLTVGNNNVAADGFTVDGEALLVGESLTYDGGAESVSDVVILGGQGRDTITTGGGDDTLLGANGHDSLTGGAGDDTISGQLGRDTMDGGLGADRMRGGLGDSVFVYSGVAESTGAGRDWVDVLKPLKDHFDLDVVVTAVDPKVNAGTLSEASFDANLAAALGAGQLGAGHAVVFKPNAGDLAGHFFMVVDANGVAGYQAGADYVMEFAAGSHPNSFAAGFFI